LVFDVVTLFPAMFLGPLQESMLGRARRASRVAVRIHDLRRWGIGPHRKVDDAPYGGGGGMILRPEPFYEAVEWIRGKYGQRQDAIVLLSPQGGRLTHASAKQLAGHERLILLCGHYEGVDERVREGLADLEVSVGDGLGRVDVCSIAGREFCKEVCRVAWELVIAEEVCKGGRSGLKEFSTVRGGEFEGMQSGELDGGVEVGAVSRQFNVRLYTAAPIHCTAV